MLLVIRSHPFVGIYFVNKGTYVSFEMVKLKNWFVKMFFGRKCSHKNNKYCYRIYYSAKFVQLC